MTIFLRRNNEIDFKKIESEIDEGLENRKTKFKAYNDKIGDIMIKDNGINEEITKDLPSELDSYCDIKIPRQISSHRKIVGPGLVKIRKFLDEEIRLSLDPVIDKQIEFNKKIIEQINSRFDEINKHTEENIKQTNYNIKEIFRLKRKIEDGD